MPYKVGDSVIVQGTPGTVVQEQVVGTETMLLVMLLVPQARWVPASQLVPPPVMATAPVGAPPAPSGVPAVSTPAPAPAPAPATTKGK